MSNLKPGIYKATVDHVPDRIVLVGKTVGGTNFGHTDSGAYHLNHITDARPLIVLDISPEQINRFVHSLRLTGDWYDKQIAEQVEAQTKPARIPEPGLWGVVEATWNVTSRATWVHDQYGWAHHSGQTVAWRALIDPVLIRDGIQS